jgi:hypothetical protein
MGRTAALSKGSKNELAESRRAEVRLLNPA